MVKNLPFNAGYMSSIPGQGTKIPRALEQLSPYAAAPESTHHNWGIRAPQPKIPHDATKI